MASNFKFQQALTVLIIILIGVFASAAETPVKNLTCVTEFPTTSYILDLKNDKYVLDIIHHNDIEHAPIYSGLFTLHTLDYLKPLIENMKTLGARISFEFKKSECTRLEDKHITCYKGEKAKLGKLDVKSVYFNAFEETNSSPYGTFKSFQVNFEYRIGDRAFRTPMNFPDNGCVRRI